MSRPRAEPTDALVLRVIPFAETSQVVHLATPHHGLVPALAKGALRATSDFEGGLTLGALGTAWLSARRGAELESLRRFRTTEAWRGVRDDLTRFQTVCYVLELLRAWMRPQLPQPALMQAAITALRAADRAPASALTGWVAWFEARALAATGHRPRLDACAVCDEAVSRAAVFSPLAGGVVHAGCAPVGPKLSLAPAQRAALQRLYTARLSEWARDPLDARALAHIRTVHDLFLPSVLERRPNALDGIVQLAHQPPRRLPGPGAPRAP